MQLNSREECKDSEPNDFGKAIYIVVGMGSIGKPTYEQLNSKFPGKVLGLDYDYDKIEQMKNLHYNVIWADTTDSELWDHVKTDHIKAIFLTMSDYTSNLHSLEQIRRIQHRKFKILAIGHYPQQIDGYMQNEADYVFDYKESLGRDFVENAMLQVNLN